MVNEFKVITLCGSTRFKKEFLEAQKRLTLEGNIVISVGMFGHSGDEEVWKPGIKDMLDRMHLSKIDMADEIFVINVDGYIGESTKREIDYAKSIGKKVNYLVQPINDICEMNYTGKSVDFCPNIDDYISSLKCPQDSFSKLRRFRPYVLPDGSLDFWYDDNKIMFRMIDSLQVNYEFGLECALNKEYCDTVLREMSAYTGEEMHLYKNELLVTRMDGRQTKVSVRLFRDYVIGDTAKEKYNATIVDKEIYFKLSSDKKTLLSWNETNGLIGKSFSVAYIPEGVENIADGAFSGCQNLERLVLPSTLNNIGNWAFADCGLIKVHFKNKHLEYIGESAFYGCFLKPEKGAESLFNTIKT